MSTLDWTHADWDSTARYSLTIDIVNTYLKGLFGNWNFYTQVADSDTIKYWVPRKLSDGEKNELKLKGLYLDGPDRISSFRPNTSRTPQGVSIGFKEDPSTGSSGATHVSNTSSGRLGNNHGNISPGTHRPLTTVALSTEPSSDKSPQRETSLAKSGNSQSPHATVSGPADVNSLRLSTGYPVSQSTVFLDPQNHQSQESNPRSILSTVASDFMSLHDAMEWKRNRKVDWGHQPFLHKSQRGRLEGRDHVFLVDDSYSMAEHWSNVTGIIDILSYILKSVDGDGLDLYFTISEHSISERKNTTSLVRLVESHKQNDPAASTEINFRLNQILDKYKAKLDSNGRWPKNPPKPLSLYILTNGVWEAECKPEIPIKNVVQKLHDLGRDREQIGIQFISFGNDTLGMERLRHLDDDLTRDLKLDHDIVDTTPWHDNIHKMLLGHLSENMDRGDPGTGGFVGKMIPGPELFEGEPIQGLERAPFNTVPNRDSATNAHDSKQTLPFRDMDVTVGDSGFAGSHSLREPGHTSLGVNNTVHDSGFAASQILLETAETKSMKESPATTMSLYDPSATASLAPLEKTYMTDLAAGLFSIIEPFETDQQILEHIFQILPDLLKAFALKLGHEGQTQMHRDACYFVHKYHERIGEFFEERFSLEEIATPAFEDRAQFQKDAIERYFNSSDEPLDVIEHSDDGEDDELEVKETEQHRTDMYFDFIVSTQAYSWLLAMLRREANLSRATPDLMEDVQKTIFATLPVGGKISRKSIPARYQGTFEMDWHPLEFLKEQEYTESSAEALERAITLTGSPGDAQAMTTIEYLSKVWPSTGQKVMSLIKRVCCSPSTDYHVETDGTEIDAQLRDSGLVVTTTGTGDAIAELGQQLAWLGAALRSSPFETGVSICLPTIRCSLLDSRLSSTDETKARILGHVLCVINFELKKIPPNQEDSVGHCWQKMFRNPVMVSGYPIVAKSHPQLGLEMPLNMMAALTGSERANEFDGNIFVKGYSAMLIATKIVGGIIVWHYLYNRQGRWISYLDHDIPVLNNIDLSHLASARHVVGWCSSCDYNAGSPDANYDIKGTGLPPPAAGFLLEKVTLSLGKIVTAGVSCAIGVKDVPLHISRGDPNAYIPRLKHIALRYVVLWDIETNRGWLVNGTSALLHLVRAWLRHSSKDAFKSAFEFDLSSFVNATQLSPDAAPEVLINKRNRGQVIYGGKTERSSEEEEKDTSFRNEQTEAWRDEIQLSKSSKKKKGYFLFENLVEQYCSVLEQMMDHQKRAMGRDGVKVKARVRRYLEGWDFAELAKDDDPRPRFETIKAAGWGWVDLIRSIEAITLFGRGFGDILRPKKFDGMCPRWESLPVDNSYLAVSAYDLNNIMEKFGKFSNSQQNLPEPIRDLLWHSPGKIIAECRCQKQAGNRALRKIKTALLSSHHDPVQFLCPKGSRHFLAVEKPDDLPPNGAVIFGHNFQLTVRWKDSGEAELEHEKPNLQQSTSHLSTTATYPSSSLALPRHRNESLSDSASQDAGRLTGTTTRSSKSEPSSTSTPVESLVDSDQSPDPPKATPNYNSLNASQHTAGETIRRPTLRRERRNIMNEMKKRGGRPPK